MKVWKDKLTLVSGSWSPKASARRKVLCRGVAERMKPCCYHVRKNSYHEKDCNISPAALIKGLRNQTKARGGKLMRRTYTFLLFPVCILKFSFRFLNIHLFLSCFISRFWLYVHLLRIILLYFLSLSVSFSFFLFLSSWPPCLRWMVSLWSALIQPAASPPGLVSSSACTPVSYRPSLRPLPHPL